MNENIVIFETTMPDGMKLFLEQQSHKVFAACRGYGYSVDNDNGFAYDILLRKGWKCSDDDAHTIIVHTVALAKKKIWGAIPCECLSCLEKEA
jgi:hypothetical protein